MAQTIKLRRSATQGAVPTTSQLSLGEVAVNTYDGKMYIKKSVGGTESIVEIGAGGGLTSSFTLYEYTASASQTTFSGSDDNSNTLAYDTGTPPRVLVYLNGVLLDYTTDYTATSGTSVVLTSAAASGDLVQIGAYKSTVTSDQSIQLDDNLKLSLGDDSDLELWHTGSNSVIHNKTGQLRVRADDLSLQSYTNEELFITAVENGAVKLFYDNSLKLETTNDGVTVTGDVEADEFIGDVRGAVLFKAQAGEALSKGDVVYISGISGNTTVVSKADADDASKMPAFGLVAAAASSGNPVDIYTNGILSGIDTSSYSEGDELFVSTTAGALTATAPTGESAALQKIGKVTRSASSGSIFIVGAGRTNAVPNLNEGRLFVGNSSNQAVADDTVHVDIANSRVGINTTTPSRTFEIHENTTNLTIGEKSGYTPSTYGPVFETNADALVLPQYAYLKGSQAYIRNESNLMRIHGDSGIKFSYYNGSATTEGMRLDNSGRFGIGTASPSRTLDISAPGNDGIRIASANALIGGGASGGDTQLIYWNGSNAYYGRSSLGGSVSNHYFRTGGADRLSVTSSGITVAGSVGVTNIVTNKVVKFNGSILDDSNITDTGSLITLGSDITISGNIAVSGTVDGRDIASDGTKLDGIESGATADQTASEILTALLTVDGTGSGLDADTLDGVHASGFIKDGGTTVTGNINTIGTESIKHRWNAFTTGRPAAGQTNEYGTVTTLTYDSSFATQLAWDIDQGNLYGRTLNLSSDSGTWVKFWHDGNDGTGSGLDADTLDGYHASSFLQSETSHADVVVDGDFTSQGIMLRGATAGSYSILTDNSANWNTAYGWGDHSTEGYITNSTASLSADKITSGTLDSARIPIPVNGDWWNNGYVRVQTDGVMEVGKYLDFHTADSGGGTDFDVRLTASSGAIDIDGNLSVDDLTVSGNLTVNGTTTTLNTATLDVEDKNITLNYGAGDTSASADGAGITIQDAVNSSTNATLLWDATNDEWDFSHSVTAPNLNISNWDTAYSWGNHASAGYLTSSSGLNASNLTSGTISNDRLSGDVMLDGNAGTIDNSSQDFDDFSSTGIHYVSNFSDVNDTVANGPSASYPWGMLRVTEFISTNYAVQEYIPHQYHGDFTRVKWNGSWTGWRKTWTSANDGSGSGLDADTLDGNQSSFFADKTNAQSFSARQTFATQTWGGDITWNTGVNVLVAGESSIDVSGSGYFQIWDSGTAAPFIKCDVGQTVEIGEAGDRGLYVHGGITATNTIQHTGTEGREVKTYMPSSYTTGDLVSGHEYGWYSDYWRVGMTRSSDTAGDDFVIEWNGTRKFDLSKDGNATFTGTISSGSITSSGSYTVPNSSQNGLKSANGNNFIYPLDQYNNMHIRSTTGSEYHDSSAYYFRKVDQTEIFRINGSGVDVRLGTLRINGTDVINSSRNIVNVGYISAGSNIGNLDAVNGIGQQMEKGDASVTTLRFDSNRYRIYAGQNAGEMITALETGNVGIGDTNPSEKLTVNGTFQHKGLEMSSGTGVDQLYSATQSLTLSTSWQDTGINGADLATGTYIIQVYANDYAVGGGHYSEYYSGTMSWMSTNTNSSISDEIVLHRAGHAPNTGILYLRTLRTASADADDLKLQIKASTSNTGSSNYVFKFRRMI